MNVVIDTCVWSLALRRANGIQGSNTDFLICAAAIRRRFSIFTADVDFKLFSRVLPLTLHEPRLQPVTKPPI